MNEIQWLLRLFDIYIIYCLNTANTAILQIQSGHDQLDSGTYCMYSSTFTVRIETR